MDREESLDDVDDDDKVKEAERPSMV